MPPPWRRARGWSPAFPRVVRPCTVRLTAEKYHLPKVGQYTGAQLAEMLETSNAPAATVEVFRKYVVYATLNAPKRIVIQPPQ